MFFYVGRFSERAPRFNHVSVPVEGGFGSRDLSHFIANLLLTVEVVEFESQLRGRNSNVELKLLWRLHPQCHQVNGSCSVELYAKETSPSRPASFQVHYQKDGSRTSSVGISISSSAEHHRCYLLKFLCKVKREIGQNLIEN